MWGQVRQHWEAKSFNFDHAPALAGIQYCSSQSSASSGMYNQGAPEGLLEQHINYSLRGIQCNIIYSLFT